MCRLLLHDLHTGCLGRVHSWFYENKPDAVCAHVTPRRWRYGRAGARMDSCDRKQSNNSYRWPSFFFFTEDTPSVPIFQLCCISEIYCSFELPHLTCVLLCVHKHADKHLIILFRTKRNCFVPEQFKSDKILYA